MISFLRKGTESCCQHYTGAENTKWVMNDTLWNSCLDMMDHTRSLKQHQKSWWSLWICLITPTHFPPFTHHRPYNSLKMTRNCSLAANWKCWHSSLWTHRRSTLSIGSSRWPGHAISGTMAWLWPRRRPLATGSRTQQLWSAGHLVGSKGWGFH